MPDNTEWVEMTHPKLGEDSTSPDGGRALVTKEAFEEVWKDKGWKLASKSAPNAAATPGGK